MSGVSFPDLEKIAAAYGLRYFRMDKIDMMQEQFAEILADDEPVICEVMSVRDQAVMPSVSSKQLEDGRLVSAPIEDMFPFLPREEFLANMIVKPVEE